MGQGYHGYTSCIQRIMVLTHQHDRAKAVAHRVLLTTRGLRAVLGPDVGGHAWQVRHVINYLSNSLLMQSPETLATRLLVDLSRCFDRSSSSLPRAYPHYLNHWCLRRQLQRWYLLPSTFLSTQLASPPLSLSCHQTHPFALLSYRSNASRPLYFTARCFFSLWHRRCIPNITSLRRCP